jgi:hypothetical protein
VDDAHTRPFSLTTFPFPPSTAAVNVWDVNHYVGQEVSKLFAEKIDAGGAAKLEDDAHKGVWEL